MAVLNLGCSSDDKENTPPSAACGISVKRQTMKKPGGGSSKQPPRRRPPLRDITWLFVTAGPCPPPPSTAVQQLQVLSDASLLPEAVRPGAGAGASDGVTMKQGSHSLRMGFR